MLLEEAYLLQDLEMEHHVFSFGLIIEGTTEKVLQFKIPLRSICNQTLGLIKKEMYFEKLKRG